MPGPVSFPEGDKSHWDELNDIVCDIHFHCDMAEMKNGKPVVHDYITYRVWLARRKKLRTGKTM